MIDIKACTIEIGLDFPVEVSREGGFSPVDKIKLKMPNRRVQAMFESLCAMSNRSMVMNSAAMEKLSDPEEVAAAKATVEAENNKKLAEQNKIPAIKSMENITFEEVMEETDQISSLLGISEFDFEKAYKLFDRMLLNNGDVRTTICLIDDKPITDVHLDKMSPGDYKKILVAYICFFGKPAKSGTTKDSSEQQGSCSLATVV